MSPEEFAKRVRLQKSQTGRERGWFDKEFVLDFHSHFWWGRLVHPVFPPDLSWSFQETQLFLDQVLDAWSLLSPLPTETNQRVHILPELSTTCKTLEEILSSPTEEETRARDDGNPVSYAGAEKEGTPDSVKQKSNTEKVVEEEKQVIHLTSVRPTFARSPSQVVHDLSFQSADVIVLMPLHQMGAEAYLDDLYRSLQGQHDYRQWDIDENLPVTNGDKNNKQKRNKKGANRRMPKPDLTRDHKFVVLFPHKPYLRQTEESSRKNHSLNKEVWKEVTEKTPGMYYFELDLFNPEQLVEVMRIILFLSCKKNGEGDILVVPARRMKEQKEFKTFNYKSSSFITTPNYPSSFFSKVLNSVKSTLFSTSPKVDTA